MALVIPACSARSGIVFFFFQAEDGIRDSSVTGVQTCALPILGVAPPAEQCLHLRLRGRCDTQPGADLCNCRTGSAHEILVAQDKMARIARTKIGRASCRERV